MARVHSPNVYNMPSGIPFLPTLAAGLKDTLGERLCEALILLPTRRAVRQLGEAFVAGESASLLPRMRTLADIDPEEPPFEPGYLTGLVDPLMPSSQRRFELARITARYHHAITDLPLEPAGMLALTDPLLAIMDDAALEEVSLASLVRLKDIEAFAAQHFQNAATLYKIIQEFWPTYVREQGVMEPMTRRVALLNELTELWTSRPPNHPVIIAGSTGTLRASARLMRCVAHMSDGMVVLPGLDKNLPDRSWEKVSAEHPQNSLKNLIETIGVTRGAVRDWPGCQSTPQQAARNRIISESLVPVDATSDWPARIQSLRKNFLGGDIFEAALEGLSIIEARTEDEEALTIALIMRETLETADKTAALITPDPALARRVKARMRRWGVDVDYSQGEPLEETMVGSFLTGLLALSGDKESPVDLAFVCKHALTNLGREPGSVCRDWYKLERERYRGVRPKQSDDSDLVSHIYTALYPLISGESERSASDWSRALSEAAEAFSATDHTPGKILMWQGEAGEAAAGVLDDLILYGDSLGNMRLPAYADLLASLMRGRVVRARYGTHPRLRILGPLEARMIEADRVILGGLNEGVWPAGLSAQPFLSRGMRMSLGLSLPERRFGLAAHDFAELAANPEVIFTRAKRSDDGPRVASRWLWRLQALVRGAMNDDTRILAPAMPYLEWARELDHVPADQVRPAARPAPQPDVTERWPNERKLSVTQIKTWVRDPYAIYAKEILGLRLLEALDQPIGPSEYGTAIHNGLEEFIKAFTTKLPEDAPSQLSKSFEKALIEAGFPDHHLAKERIRLIQAAEDMTALIRSRREEGWSYVQAENKGSLNIAEIDFTLSSRADLIEKSAEGYAVIDYKTGTPTAHKVVQAGFDPQLPLTGVMVSRGAFDKVSAGDVAQMLYIRVKGAGNETEAKFITSPENKNGWTSEEYQVEALEDLKKLVRAFDKYETTYVAQPRIQFMNDYGDFDDLARRGEWAQLGDDGGET